jgi:hypothetical protein
LYTSQLLDSPIAAARLVLELPDVFAEWVDVLTHVIAVRQLKRTRRKPRSRRMARVLGLKFQLGAR